MALMDSLLGAAASALTGGNAQLGMQNQAIQMVIAFINQQGGIGNVMGQLQQGGLSGVLESWISTGANQAVSGSDLQSALGGSIGEIAEKFGMNSQQASELIAQHLPQVVDSVTPNGNAAEANGFGLDDVASIVLRNLIK